MSEHHTPVRRCCSDCGAFECSHELEPGADEYRVSAAFMRDVRALVQGALLWPGDICLMARTVANYLPPETEAP